MQGQANTNQVARLPFQISAWSSHSANYHPRNIQIDRPSDQSSRWSSGTNNQAQFITLKLDRVSIAQTITFGKYHKIHVCNLKEFKVFGGVTPENMVELMHSGLRNDTEQETFTLKSKTRDVVFPCLYIKIVPLLAHGANFNFSIWFVEIRGVADQDYVQGVYRDYMLYRENEATRLCLKHFRQRNHAQAFATLQQSTHVMLEDPLLTQLYTSIVVQGDYQQTEALLDQTEKSKHFVSFIADCPYKPHWTKIIPRQRGGHQMCIDQAQSRIYLLGGWNGTQDMPDFWVYSISTHTWRCISKDTSKQGGPGARSCHKICFDPKSRVIYSLGKYVEADARPNGNLEGDFWVFDLGTERWRRISSNTAFDGGPELIYDHQMVIDSDRQVLYVFGGRTVSPEQSVTYSGLYAYKISTAQWKLLRPDTPDAPLKSRIGHSMLFNPSTRQLYIFAGQRAKDYLSDLHIYNIDTDTVEEVTHDYSKQGGPEPGFTQRATLHNNEIYILSGLMRDKTSTNESVRNSFWVYTIDKQRWTRVYQNENVGAEYWDKMRDVEPCPRYAHQLVLGRNGRLWLFGGNPGSTSSPKLRLDDFWELRLERPLSEDVLRMAVLQVRMQRFREMCLEAAREASEDKLHAALAYLQQDVSEAANHEDPAELAELHALTMWLFAFRGDNWGNACAQLTPSVSMYTDELQESSSSGTVYALRSTLYNTLLRFYPESMKEPTNNLVDLIPMDI